LARSLDAEATVPGAGFASRGGGALSNSKAVFRAVAASARVALPPGAVVSDRRDAEEALVENARRGVVTIVKKEYDQGCAGNDVLTPKVAINPIGARRAVVATDRAGVQSYLTENWDWLTNAGRHRVVIEEYFPGSMAVFAELSLGDSGVELAGLGEMLAAPLPDGQILPPVGLSHVALAELVDSSHRLCNALHAMGHRGNVSADAIFTPTGDVLFTEYNGRITGSTHIHATIGARVVGKDTMRRRVLLERQGWSAPSFSVAVERLQSSGLAYDHAAKLGIVLVSACDARRSRVSYCVVAESLEGALSLERKLEEVSPRARQES
jgi:hypothetical protein